jgi:hypothetical protein
MGRDARACGAAAQCGKPPSPARVSCHRHARSAKRSPTSRFAPSRSRQLAGFCVGDSRPRPPNPRSPNAAGRTTRSAARARSSSTRTHRGAAQRPQGPWQPRRGAAAPRHAAAAAAGRSSGRHRRGRRPGASRTGWSSSRTSAAAAGRRTGSRAGGRARCCSARAACRAACTSAAWRQRAWTRRLTRGRRGRTGCAPRCVQGGGWGRDGPGSRRLLRWLRGGGPFHAAAWLAPPHPAHAPHLFPPPSPLHHVPPGLREGGPSGSSEGGQPCCRGAIWPRLLRGPPMPSLSASLRRVRLQLLPHRLHPHALAAARRAISARAHPTSWPPPSPPPSHPQTPPPGAPASPAHTLPPTLPPLNAPPGAPPHQRADRREAHGPEGGRQREGRPFRGERGNEHRLRGGPEEGCSKGADGA